MGSRRIKRECDCRRVRVVSSGVFLGVVESREGESAANDGCCERTLGLSSAGNEAGEDRPTRRRVTKA